jgi:hypothetical protein
VPLLDAIVTALGQGLKQGQGQGQGDDAVSGPGPALSLFSCHDTNLISLLYSLRDLGRFSGPDALAGVSSGGRLVEDGIVFPEVISWPGFGEFHCNIF